MNQTSRLVAEQQVSHIPSIASRIYNHMRDL